MTIFQHIIVTARAADRARVGYMVILDARHAVRYHESAQVALAGRRAA